jgi:hypothetical protein
MTTPLLLAAVCVPHPLNWFGGWGMVLAAFVTGAGLGLFFHRDDFLGGYASFSRRMLRLGHIAWAALGMMNVLFALSPLPATLAVRAASACFLAGAVLMPLVCFLAAWRKPLRHLFPLPVAALVLAVVFTLIGGLS